MMIIKNSFYKDIDHNKFFNGKKTCFLDIETTGFSREYNIIYLIGIVFYNSEKRKWELRQIFAEDKDSEKEVLFQLIKYIKDFDLIVTYNGDSFDIPFINSRLKIYGIDFDLFSIENFDICRLIMKNRQVLEFENYKLKTIEKNLSIFRDDIYSGGECIKFYKDYIKNKNTELLEKILQHNYDDLFYLIDVIKIQDIIKNKKSINISNGKVTIDTIVAIGDVFKVDGYIYSIEDLKLIHYDNLYTIDINNDKFKVELDYNIGLVSPKEKGLFIDKNKFALDVPAFNANYKIPNRFILLQVEKRVFLDNIKNVVSCLIERSINSLM